LGLNGAKSILDGIGRIIGYGNDGNLHEMDLALLGSAGFPE
jgi:hypothetical protein